MNSHKMCFIISRYLPCNIFYDISSCILNMIFKLKMIVNNILKNVSHKSKIKVVSPLCLCHPDIGAEARPLAIKAALTRIFVMIGTGLPGLKIF